MTQTRKFNEDKTFYFEKVFAALQFSKLLTDSYRLEKVHIKPDRKFGAPRRIEDISVFKEGKKVDVIQLKYSQAASSESWHFSDLANNSVQGTDSEGTNVFKFLKSWRYHKENGHIPHLIFAGNKNPDTKLSLFYKGLVKVRKGEIKWSVFSEDQKTNLDLIKQNCSSSPFVNNHELKSFILSFDFVNTGNIKALQEELKKELKKIGISDSEKIGNFMDRSTQSFLNDDIEIGKDEVLNFIEYSKTGLLQRIDTPDNYIERVSLEKKILAAVEKKKKTGGFVFLFSPSGSGKTILLSRMAENYPDFLPYYCRIRPFEVDKNQSGIMSVQRLSAKYFKVDLMQRFKELHMLDTMVSINDEEEYIDSKFEESLLEVSRKALNRPNKKFVIIIDALDQVHTDKIKKESLLSAIPEKQYPGIVFLLSTWEKKYLPDKIKELSSNSGITLRFSEEEIKAYFGLKNIKLTSDQVDIIFKKTKGLAISLFYMLNKIKSEPTKLDDIIRQDGEYDEVLKWYIPIWNSLDSKERKGLGYLCYHFAEVNKENLSRLVKLDFAGYNSLLEKISPFIKLKSNLIEPYHDSFRRFIVSKLEDVSDSIHLDIANYYSSSENIKSAYAKKYLTKHLNSVRKSKNEVNKLFKKILKNDFVNIVIKSQIDYVTKAEIGEHVAKHFFETKQDKELVQLSVKMGSIYPTTLNDDIYCKAQIGTKNLLTEIEKELKLPSSNSDFHRTDWLFKRIKTGNILINNDDESIKKFGRQLLEDGLFRYSLNPRILWSRNEHYDWDNFFLLGIAAVNINRYKSAVRTIKNIKFTKNTAHNTTFLLSELAKIHLVQYRKDKNGVIEQLKKSSKIEKLITYLMLEGVFDIKTIKSLFVPLFKDESLYKYLTAHKQYSLSLELAESIYIFNVKSGKLLMNKLLKKTKFEVPYFDRGWTNWGQHGDGVDFVKHAAINKLVDKNLDIKKYYEVLFEERFKSRDDMKVNKSFVELLNLMVTYQTEMLKHKAGKITDENFISEIWVILDKFYIEIKKHTKVEGFYSSSVGESILPYHQNIFGILEKSISYISEKIPSKIVDFVKQVELRSKDTIIESDTRFQSLFINCLDSNKTALMPTIQRYIGLLIEQRKSEKADSYAKSDNLKTLAIQIADKGLRTLAEDVYKAALKYSMGISSKEDLSVLNLVDCLKTSDKKEDFVTVHEIIKKIAPVVEGTWYYSQGILKSAMFSNINLGFEYFDKFIENGDISLNTGIINVFKVFFAKYSYKETLGVMPLLDLFEYNSNNERYSIEDVYSQFILIAIKNSDKDTALSLFDRFSKYLNRFVYVIKRYEFYVKFKDALVKEKDLNTKFLIKKVDRLVNDIKAQGYTLKSDVDTKNEVHEDKNFSMKKSIALAKKNSIDKLITGLGKIEDSYMVKRTLCAAIPYLSDTSLNKIKSWSNKKSINLDDDSDVLIALIRRFSSQNALGDESIIKRKIKTFIKNTKYQSSVSEIFEQVVKTNFKNKGAFISECLLLSTHRLVSSSYHLNQLYIRSSDVIDKYCIKFKSWLFEPLLEEVEKSVKLSTAK